MSEGRCRAGAAHRRRPYDVLVPGSPGLSAACTLLRPVTDRHRARRTLVLAAIVLGSLFVVQPWPAGAQSKKTTTTTTTSTVPETSASIAPGETAPNGGPLLVPGEADSASSAAADTSNSDNTGTVVALVISGLLVVALLLGLLTYWFWRNTRPTKAARPAPEVPAGPAPAEG